MEQERMTELEQNQASHHEITTLTAEIVGAYVGHHTVATTDLPGSRQETRWAEVNAATPFAPIT